MRRPWRVALAGAWMGVSLLACGGGASPAHVPARTHAVDVLVSGCRAPNDAPCRRLLERPLDEVVVWVDLPPSTGLVVRVDGRTVEAKVLLVEGGSQLTFGLEAGARRFSVVDEDGRGVLDREVRWQPFPPEVLLAKLGFLLHGSTGWERGLLRGAKQFREGQARLRTARFLQKLRFSAHRLDESQLMLEELLPQAQALGALHDVAEISAALAFQRTRARDFSGARRALDVLATVREASPEAAVQASLREAELAERVFDYAGALEGYRNALRLARRLGRANEAYYIQNLYIMLVSELGLGEEAQESIATGLAALDTLELDCEQRAVLRGNFGWSRLRLAALGLDQEISREEFERARDALTHRCPNAAEAANQTANLALAALLEGDVEESQAWVAQLGTSDAAPWLRPFVEELTREIRIHDPSWSEGPPLIAEPQTARGTGWSRWNQHGRELRNWGFDAAALDAFARAEDELGVAATTLPLALGQGTYVGSRTSSLEALVELELAAGRDEDALCAVRKARRRSMSQVDRMSRVASLSPAEREEWFEQTAAFAREQDALEAQGREAWRGSVDQQRATRERLGVRADLNRTRLQHAMEMTLGAPPALDCADAVPPGETHLHAVPVGDQVALFLRNAGGVEATLVPHPAGMDLEAWGEVALGAWRARLSEASLLRISALGDLDALPWGRVVVDGSPLVEWVAIEFSLDLPAGNGGLASDEALVISDPSQNLEHAREEGNAAFHALRATALDVRRLQGGEATRAATREQVDGIELLYFAGHAEYDERTPWGSSMKLADGAMGMAELFALEDMPRLAFLMGCETGATDASTRSGGINLGRGFLLAGTSHVLVARVPVDDALAARVGLATMTHYLELRSLPAALRATQLEVRAEDPNLPWWEFRVEAR